MGIGRDGPDESRDRERGERSTDDESGESDARGADDADIESALAGILEEGDDEEELFEGGDDDPDAILEAFDEETPEEVIGAETETDNETGETVGSDGTDEAVSGLFEDLGDVNPTPVDIEPEGGPATGGETVTDAGGETETETDTADVTDPSVTEATDEVEGLLDDLTTVDVDVDSAPESGSATDEPGTETPTAHTQPTVLDPEETEATGFQWLGEDVQVFSGSREGDPDAVLETYEESTPEEVIAAAAETDGVSATDLFGDIGEGGPDYPATPESENGEREQSSRAGNGSSVRASDLFGGEKPGTNGETPSSAGSGLATEGDDDTTAARGDAASPETTIGNDVAEAGKADGSVESGDGDGDGGDGGKSVETGGVSGGAGDGGPDGEEDSSRGVLGRIVAAIRGLL